MKKRLLTAAVGIPLALCVLIASVYFPPILYLVLLVLCLVGIFEALRAAGANNERLLYVPSFIYGVVVMEAPFLGGSDGMFEIVAAASLIYLFVMFGIMLKKHATLRLETLCTTMILTMFVSLPFMTVELIFGNLMKNSDGSASYANGIALVAYCLILAWVADGGAYFIGSAFGKHKLAPTISPKKTIEGSVGGFVVSMIISLAAAYIYADVLNYVSGSLNILNMVIISAVCIVMSMFGDMAFSVVKRQYKVKDFGNLLPGHGGVLDRFDSVLFVCPTFYILCNLMPIVNV